MQCTYEPDDSTIIKAIFKPYIIGQTIEENIQQNQNIQIINSEEFIQVKEVNVTTFFKDSKPTHKSNKSTPEQNLIGNIFYNFQNIRKESQLTCFHFIDQLIDEKYNSILQWDKTGRRLIQYDSKELFKEEYKDYEPHSQLQSYTKGKSIPSPDYDECLRYYKINNPTSKYIRVEINFQYSKMIANNDENFGKNLHEKRLFQLKGIKSQSQEKNNNNQKDVYQYLEQLKEKNILDGYSQNEYLFKTPITKIIQPESEDIVLIQHKKIPILPWNYKTFSITASFTDI